MQSLAAKSLTEIRFSALPLNYTRFPPLTPPVPARFSLAATRIVNIATVQFVAEDKCASQIFCGRFVKPVLNSDWQRC